ncbi:hypothetical protein BDV93DRAFT_528284 [Ceratobasidium sp. AG-I]|nr:hypothetical protein BDV93DRAFT_528284 [Ceratobasidium sp. AG-I]
MTVARSEKYFFQRGDIVIQVEETLFKVHRDLLERHSGYFENLFDKPSDEEEWSSPDNPLYLSEDLSSAQAFIMICRFLYPNKLCALPAVKVKELDVWEPVLDAAIALELPEIQDYILKRLARDKKYLHLESSRLLKIAERTGDEDLKWECYFDLFYRVGPISLTDAIALGSSNLALITHVREQVRNDLMWKLAPADMDKSKLCTKANCQRYLVEAIRLRMNTPPKNHPACDVFDIQESTSLCASCNGARVKLANSYRSNRLDRKVRDWVSKLQPPPLSSSDSREVSPLSNNPPLENAA